MCVSAKNVPSSEGGDNGKISIKPNEAALCPINGYINHSEMSLTHYTQPNSSARPRARHRGIGEQAVVSRLKLAHHIVNFYS